MNERIKSFLLMALPWILCGLLVFIVCRQCQNTKDLEDANKHNIEALTDSVHYWHDKFGNEVAEKAILIGDINTLSLANDSLAQRVKALVNKPDNVVYIENEIIHEKHDTAWVVQSRNMEKLFDFSDSWRTLSGNVTLKDSILGLTIDKDIVNADITIALKDGRAYVSSANPYLHVTNIEGYQLPKERKRYLHIGPQIGFGVNTEGKFYPYIGIGGTISLMSW